MNVFVAVGPTVTATEVTDILPSARILPPVAAGDLVDHEARRGDVFAIIDGVFRQRGSVRHKEILALLDRGVRVVGSSGMGALRAAELRPYGMEGIGRIFQMFASGELDGDDEVAVLHGEPPEYQQLTVALVNLRIGLARGIAQGTIGEKSAAAIIARVKAQPFLQRSHELICEALKDLPEVPGSSDELRRFVVEHIVDQKHSDAFELISLLATLPLARPRAQAARVYRTFNYAQLVASTTRRTDTGRDVTDLAVLTTASLLYRGYPTLVRDTLLRVIGRFEAQALNFRQPGDKFLERTFRTRAHLVGEKQFTGWLNERCLNREDLMLVLRDSAALNQAANSVAEYERRNASNSLNLVVAHYLLRRGLIQANASLPERWESLLAPSEMELPVDEQLVLVCARGFVSVRWMRELLASLRMAGLYRPSAERAALVRSLVNRSRALRSDADPRLASSALLFRWASDLWDSTADEMPWRLLDRGFTNSADLQRAAAPHHLAYVVSRGRLGPLQCQ